MRNLIFLAMLIFISCKNNQEITSTEETVSVEIPSAFVDFYTNFHSDSIFQLDHIIFPLKQKSDSTMWLKSEWKTHKAFDDQSGAYIREFDNFNGIIIETIRDKNNMFLIQRRFTPSGDSYNLIYYSLDNKLDMWGERVLKDSLEVED